jgi:tRNA pseudouridine32 synthase/23S rRNA pseudouridine746 synthase/23S rRNA pseudouridine1911/1915/1917 synthase
VGERHEADLVRLAAGAGERLLPVHRIDKVTSGAVLLAKRPSAHAELTRQFQRRSAGKLYLAVTRSRGLPERGTIELPLSVGRKGRVRVAARRASILADPASGRWSVPPAEVFTHTRTYPSLTTFANLWEERDDTLLAVRPVTGRRHQIRVHLAWIGHPIEGDPLFDSRPGPGAPRTGLHSWRLAFDAPWSAASRIQVEAPPGDDFWACLQLQPTGPVRETILRTARALEPVSG